MTKKHKILFALAIGILIILASTFYFIRKNEVNKQYYFYYDIEILKTDPSTNYTLILPIPAFQNDEIYWTNRLLSESVRQGSMDVTIVETDYGRGLMLNSSDNCHFYIRLNELVPANLSTLNSIGSKFQIYAYYNNISHPVSVDLNMGNFEIINSTEYLGQSIRIHVYPTMIGWFEYNGLVSESTYSDMLP